MAPALMALGAQMHILGPKGPRSLPLEEFFVTTVQRLYQENVLEREEIITALTVPPVSSEMKQVFKSRIRQADEFSLATVALAARVQAGTCVDCRVVLGGVAPRP
jgi:CO/xanthine dehydrogenase FAD-binding subunit